jgi:hypothetical protein
MGEPMPEYLQATLQAHKDRMTLEFRADSSFLSTMDVLINSNEVSQGRWRLLEDGKMLQLQREDTPEPMTFKVIEMSEEHLVLESIGLPQRMSFVPAQSQ